MTIMIIKAMPSAPWLFVDVLNGFVVGIRRGRTAYLMG